MKLSFNLQEVLSVSHSLFPKVKVQWPNLGVYRVPPYVGDWTQIFFHENYKTDRPAQCLNFTEPLSAHPLSLSHNLQISKCFKVKHHLEYAADFSRLHFKKKVASDVLTHLVGLQCLQKYFLNIFYSAF